MQNLILGALYLVFILGGQVLFKKAAALVKGGSFAEFLLSLITNLPLFGAVAFYFAAMFVWVWMLKTIQLSHLFPVMTAILLILIPLVSQHFLEETMGVRYWMGVLLMFGGIALIAADMTKAAN